MTSEMDGRETEPSEGQTGGESEASSPSAGLSVGEPFVEPELSAPIATPFLAQPMLGGSYDPAQAREYVRGTIAVALVAALIGVVLFSMLIVWFKPSSTAELNEVLQLLLAPLVGLVGAATGFYYGTRQS